MVLSIQVSGMLWVDFILGRCVHYNGKTRSKPWLLMPQLLASPGYLQPCYWLWRINRSLSFIKKDFSTSCVISSYRNNRKSKCRWLSTKLWYLHCWHTVLVIPIFLCFFSYIELIVCFRLFQRTLTRNIVRYVISRCPLVRTAGNNISWGPTDVNKTLDEIQNKVSPFKFLSTNFYSFRNGTGSKLNHFSSKFRFRWKIRFSVILWLAISLLQI